MDARRHLDVPIKVKYKVVITTSELDDPIIRICNSVPQVTALGYLIKVDFIDQIVYIPDIRFIQIDEVLNA